jgi:hypothetical protein
MMAKLGRPISFWVIVGFFATSIPLMLMGQTMAVVNYDLAVRFGLQESLRQVSEYGVQVNRAFGAGDSLVLVPLMGLSLIGLYRRKRCSLLTTAAVAGISAYWSVTIGFILLFLPGTPGYAYVPAVEMWIFVGTNAVFGVWCLGLLMVRGDTLLL